MLYFDCKVTWFCTEPGMLIRFHKSDVLEKYQLPTLKEVMNAGAHFKKEHYVALSKKLPHAFIMNGYGISRFHLKVSHDIIYYYISYHFLFLLDLYYIKSFLQNILLN